MLSAAAFRELVSGQRRGIAATLARVALRGAEMPYSLAMRFRNWRYQTGRAKVHRVAVPVISVGNLSMGGTGKSPMVAWLARWLRRQEVRVTLISRGYGGEQGARNDEALELEELLPDVPHLQNPDRVAAATTAIEEFECQAILLDDGFQHRRLARDVDLVLLDACEPFGFDHVFPRGTLREPVCGLRRAQIVGLSRADMATEPQRQAIRERVKQHAPEALWLELSHRPQSLRNARGETAALESLGEQRVAAFCGIGNPAGFRHTLETQGYRVAGFREFADHHNYTRQDVDDLNAWVRSQDVAAVLCTHKDLVKIQLLQLGDRPLWAVAIGLEFLAGQAELEEFLTRLLGSAGLPAG